MTHPNSDKAIQTLFSDAQGYARDYEGAFPLGHFYRTRLLRVFELLGDVRGKRVLDVGCGPGMAGLHFASRGSRYCGIDLSAQMVREATHRVGGLGWHHLLRARMQQLPFKGACFDVVVCLGALEYVDNAADAVRELTRVCADGGAVVVSMLNERSPYRAWRAFLSRLRSATKRALERPTLEEHPDLHVVAPPRLVDLLRHGGLSVGEVVYYDYNLWLSPLDRYFPSLEVATARRLECLRNGPFKRLGTGFLVKAVRTLGASPSK